jgi:phosphoribosylformylglycinamidine cyclo-ligase
VARAVASLVDAAAYRAPAAHGRPIRAPGHYAGLLRIGRETLAVTTDTVGTKVLLAARMDRWEEVGEDLVAINVNDLASVGARPAGLVDTVLCSRTDERRFRSIGRGLRRGLARAGCSLLGGETAVVPDVVEGTDLGATAFGFFPRGRRPVLGARIAPGDRILGVPSSGVHANGFTLVRRVLREAGLDPRRPRDGGRRPVGEELLAPTRTYSPISEALAPLPSTHGFAHISGGGVRNLPRLSPRVRYVLDRWPAPSPLYRWIQAQGGISDREMYQTFNMGVGFVAIVGERAAPEALQRLRRAGARDAREIGTVEDGRGIVLPALGLRYEGYA